VERLYRNLKATIMCHVDVQLTQALPLVLIGMRFAYKEHLSAYAAELVYGEPIRVPRRIPNATHPEKRPDTIHTAAPPPQKQVTANPGSTTLNSGIIRA
jgi:hypothetical protein